MFREQAASEGLDAALSNPFGMKSGRGFPRYHVRWKVALIFDALEDKPTYHGRTHDLNLAGTGVLTHKNVFAEAPVVVLLAIPPQHRGRKQKVIEIRARQVYAVYSGETYCFRLGLEFMGFKADGYQILQEVLSQHRPIIEVPSYDHPSIFREG